jgi:hypothetical protein
VAGVGTPDKEKRNERKQKKASVECRWTKQQTEERETDARGDVDDIVRTWLDVRHPQMMITYARAKLAAPSYRQLSAAGKQGNMRTQAQ